LTLDSVGITTPPAVDVQQSEKELASIDSSAEPAKTEEVMPAKVEEVIPAKTEEVVAEEHPIAERFYTVGPGTGAGLFSSGVKPEEVDGAQKVERPGVERFETAHEDLNLLASKA
jgi:hypothetical protein